MEQGLGADRRRGIRLGRLGCPPGGLRRLVPAEPEQREPQVEPHEGGVRVAALEVSEPLHRAVSATVRSLRRPPRRGGRDRPLAAGRSPRGRPHGRRRRRAALRVWSAAAVPASSTSTSRASGGAPSRGTAGRRDGLRALPPAGPGDADRERGGGDAGDTDDRVESRAGRHEPRVALRGRGGLHRSLYS